MKEDLSAEICNLIDSVGMQSAQTLERDGAIPSSVSLVVFDPVEGVAVRKLPGEEIFFSGPEGKQLLGGIIRATLQAAPSHISMGMLTVAEAWMAKGSDDPSMMNLSPSQRPDRTECLLISFALKGVGTFAHSLNIVNEPKRHLELKPFTMPAEKEGVMWNRFSGEEPPPRERMC